MDKETRDRVALWLATSYEPQSKLEQSPSSGKMAGYEVGSKDKVLI